MRVLAMLGLIVLLRWWLLATFIVARADQQQAWRLAGDPRGIYGEYPPLA